MRWCVATSRACTRSFLLQSVAVPSALAMGLFPHLLLIGSCTTSSAWSAGLTPRAAVETPLQTILALRTHHPFCPASSTAAGARLNGAVLMHAAQPSSRVKSENRLVRRENMMRRLEPSTTPREPDGPPEDDPSTEMVLAVVRAADARKAKEICALRVGHLTSATSYFVNMQGSSKAQIQAIVKSIEDDLGEQFSRSASRQGKAVGGWVCLDFDDVVVNIFSEKERAFYQVEKFWAAAQRLDLSGVVTPDFAPADAPTAVVGEADDVDDDVWALGDDDWLLDSAADTIALDPFTDAGAGADDDDDDTDDDVHADADADADVDLGADGEAEAKALTDEAWAVIESLRPQQPQEAAQAVEAAASTVEAAAAEAEAAVGGVGESAGAEEEEEEEEEDWALGDSALQQLVERAEGGWRDLMAEDGIEFDVDGEAMLGAELSVDDDDDDGVDSLSEADLEAQLDAEIAAEIAAQKRSNLSEEELRALDALDGEL